MSREAGGKVPALFAKSVEAVEKNGDGVSLFVQRPPNKCASNVKQKERSLRLCVVKSEVVGMVAAKIVGRDALGPRSGN